MIKERQIKDIEKDLLEPLFEHFVQNGLENISIREICKNVNISSGSLYYWFNGKDEIVYATINYGLGKTVKRLLDFAGREIANTDKFFDVILDEVNLCKKEFRLLFQVAASPVYGQKLRENAFGLHELYDECSDKFSKALNFDKKTSLSVVFALVSIIVDYVVWEDTDATRLQLGFLKEHLELRRLNSLK